MLLRGRTARPPSPAEPDAREPRSRRHTPIAGGRARPRSTRMTSALAGLRREAEEHLERARSIRGEERAQVVADLESEVDRIAAAWARHNGQPAPPSAAARTTSTTTKP